VVDDQRWSLTDQPAEVVDLRDPAALTWVADYYGQASPGVVRTLLGQAYALGAQTALIEYRYLDADYRDEHARFYSTTFRRYPSVTHRLHFFAKPPPAELFSSSEPARFATLEYLGYAVMRPVPAAPVGRTMLRPPASLRPAVTCTVTDEVNLLGEPLTVEGAPFIAQDAQLVRCAHATLWVSGYVHHRRWRSRRLLPGAIADAVPVGAGFGRTLPSPGLTINQLSGAASAVGLPPLVYDLAYLPAGESIPRIACRYLNGGVPVIVAGGGHAFVLVGYQRVDPGTLQERIEFIRQDDEIGPYQLVPNFNFDTYSPWEYLVVPLPNRLYLSGEEAEVIGRARLRAAYRRSGAPLDLRAVTFRTTPMLSNDFKTGLETRGMPAEQAAIYRRMPMSRWIWVIEAIDRAKRAAPEHCVLGEAIVDATDHSRDRHVLAWRYGTNLSRWIPDLDIVRSASGLPDPGLIASVGPNAG